MKQVVIKSGSARLVDVPGPRISQFQVLVKLHCSCLSIGTERTSLSGTSIPLWQRALDQPDKAIELIKLSRDLGFSRTASLLRSKKLEEFPTGYSAAGTVIEIGSSVTDLSVGDRVACSGALHAYHSEYICVPRNLCVPIPNSLDFASASTVTLGAIALQGVRRANPSLGETFVVLGLGILGQITCQILRANGCDVIGIDLNDDRIALSKSLGATHAISARNISDNTISILTDGYGADAVIITAASSSDEIVSQAFRMCRRKGRVVLVGDVGLHLKRSDFYFNEIDFLISTSYGPGRYDPKYEEEGNDYPIGYVRWTENRNMQQYIKLLCSCSVNIRPLISSQYQLEDVSLAYESISSSENPLLVLLNYPKTDNISNANLIPKNVTVRCPNLSLPIRLAVIGAGGFARSTHLPNIQKLKHLFELKAIVNRTGMSARNASLQFPCDFITSNVNDVLSDPNIDAVMICTRHDSHASLVHSALVAGKHVFVEKPLALNIDELDMIEECYTDKSIEFKPILFTGYNRRFSSYAQHLRKVIVDCNSPFIINYKMNAGYVPPQSWLHSPQGGGRNIGEACHIYDLFTFLTQSQVSDVSAHSISPNSGHYLRSDNFVTSFSFDDGSVANLVYTSLGSKKYPKESSDLFINGTIASMTNYYNVDFQGNYNFTHNTFSQDKGLIQELEAFASGIVDQCWPIPLWQQLQTTKLSFLVESIIHS